MSDENKENDKNGGAVSGSSLSSGQNERVPLKHQVYSIKQTKGAL